MVARDDVNASVLRKVMQEIRELRVKVNAGFSSITRGALRIASNEGLLVEGSAKVSGWLVVTGTGRVNGRLEGSGTLDWTGPAYFRGTSRVEGNFTVTGSTALNGDVTLNNDLTLGSGRIVSGPLVIDRNGSYGGRVVASGSLLLDAGSSVILGAPTTVQGGVTAVGLITGTSMQSLSNINALGNITALGDIGGGSKSFWIDHPTKDGKQLRHGSLEGPEHGVFYRGVVEFDTDGEAVFELPEYFTALVLDDDVPTVQVTGIGRPFPTGAELVTDERFTVYGEAGRRAHVMVTAARERFDVEPDKTPADPIASDWKPPAADEEEP